MTWKMKKRSQVLFFFFGVKNVQSLELIFYFADRFFFIVEGNV